MPFETLESATEIETLPEGVESSLSVMPEISNVDQFGGMLRADPENDQLIYTDADGQETTVDFRDGYDDGFGGNELSGFRLPPEGHPAVYGDDLDSFIIPLVDVRPPDFNGGVFSGNYGYLTVSVDADGNVQVNGDFLEADAIPGNSDRFEVYPLGDGRVGYVIGESGGVNTSRYGVYDDDDVNGATIVTGGNTTGIQNDGVFAALPDGGTVFLIEDATSTPVGRLKIVQYDSNDDVIETGYIDGFLLENSDAEVVGIRVDEDGELEVYYEILAEGSSDPTFFRETYDLLPAAIEQTIVPTDNDDLIDLTDGDDVLNALAGDDTVFGRGGADLIDGGAGNDDLRGGLGDDVNSDGTSGIVGGIGDDFLRGNKGNDALFGGDGLDDLNGGFGDDVVFGGADDDKVSGFDGNDVLNGDSGNDRMHGGRGNDSLFGGDGDDTIRGAEGDDTLTGGDGDDLLIGGDGADTYSFDLTAVNGADVIKDFSVGEDKIALIGNNDLTFDDIFLSQEDSAAIIQAGDTTIRLKGTDIEDLSEDDFLL